MPSHSRTNRRSAWFKAGENPVKGTRVKVAPSDKTGESPGERSRNLAGVGSSRPGDRRDRARDGARGWGQKPHREELNHERPVKGLPVTSFGDGAEPRKLPAQG